MNTYFDNTVGFFHPLLDRASLHDDLQTEDDEYYNRALTFQAMLVTWPLIDKPFGLAV